MGGFVPGSQVDAFADMRDRKRGRLLFAADFDRLPDVRAAVALTARALNLEDRVPRYFANTGRSTEADKVYLAMGAICCVALKIEKTRFVIPVCGSFTAREIVDYLGLGRFTSPEPIENLPRDRLGNIKGR